MQTKNIDHLIIKFIEGELSEKESERLKDLLKKEENKAYFEEYVELNYLIHAKQEFNYRRPYEIAAATSGIKSGRSYKNLYRIAAVFIVLITGAYFLNLFDFSKEVPVVVNNDIEIGTDKATLTLEDGSKVALGEGERFVSDAANSNGEELIYIPGQSDASSENIAFNYLTIPRGGEFFIQLSDDTKVWLNSESKIKYPVNFIAGETREVELIYGEAYFEVSPSSKHEGATFKVITQGQAVEVLGTEFNVKAYQDDQTIATTLVEGKVEVEVENRKELLAPSQQSSYNTSAGTLDVKQVDLDFEIAWRNGQFMFKEQTFSEVAKVLARWYDVNISFEDETIADMHINGVLSKDQNIEYILITLKNIKNINYEINENNITIK